MNLYPTIIFSIIILGSDQGDNNYYLDSINRNVETVLKLFETTLFYDLSSERNDHVFSMILFCCGRFFEC